jgi:Skp family chaperone for outer membrane proteins
MKCCLSRHALLGVVLAGVAAGGVGLWIALEQPATAQTVAPAAQRIATLDALAVVERLVLSDRYKPARDKLSDEASAQLKVLSDTLRDYESKAQALAQDSPELKALASQYQTVSQQLSQAEQKAVADQDRFNAQQIAEAFRLVSEAATALASQRGYTHVVQTRIGDVTFRSQGVAGTIQEILARPIVTSPAADDLTSALIEQFGVANVSIEPQPPAQPQPMVPAPVTPAPATPGAAPAGTP